MSKLTFLSLSLALALPVLTQAQDTGTVSPGGGTIVTITGNADNYISIPYPNNSYGTVRISAVGEAFVVLGGDLAAIKDLPFDAEGLYYAEFTTGDLAGVRYNIISLSSTTLFLETLGDDLRSHPAGTIELDDQIRIVRHWTLGEIFGNDDTNILLEPTASLFALKDLVFVPDNLQVGINKTPRSFYYKAGQGWRTLQNPVTDQGNFKILPGQGLIVRRRVAEDTELVSFGNNRFFPFSVYVQGGDGSSGNDSLLSLQFPKPVTMLESGLADLQADGNPVVEPSPSILQIKDQVMLYEPGSDTPVILFYLASQGWRTMNGDDADGLLIKPGSAFYVRKGAQSLSTDWKFDQ